MPGLVDAPVIDRDRLTNRQKAGESCAWCAGTASPRFPVGDLRACECCAGLYGVPEAPA
jgi:hypothetical protein